MDKFCAKDFVVDKVLSFRFCWSCPSCNGEYELIKDKTNILTDPHICPHCGFDLHKYRHEEAVKKQNEIESNEYCQLRYDLLGAHECGIRLHPQEQMKLLGYKLIDSVPQSIADCWWFTVDKFIMPLPEYLCKIKYLIGEP